MYIALSGGKDRWAGLWLINRLLDVLISCVLSVVVEHGVEDHGQRHHEGAVHVGFYSQRVVVIAAEEPFDVLHQALARDSCDDVVPVLDLRRQPIMSIWASDLSEKPASYPGFQLVCTDMPGEYEELIASKQSSRCGMQYVVVQIVLYQLWHQKLSPC